MFDLVHVATLSSQQARPEMERHAALLVAIARAGTQNGLGSHKFSHYSNYTLGK